MKKTFLFVSILVLLGTTLWALEDTPENRGQEADRFLKAMPAKEMLEDMTKQMLKFVPESQRQKMQEAVKNIDFTAVEKAMKDSMMKTFTVDELKALADFYNTPVGKSAMKKMGAYMADLGPTLQQETMKAMLKAKGEEGEKKGEEKKKEE
jgi:hypothetical protein